MKSKKGSAIMVLGVSGVGKTTFGRYLASALKIRFLDIPEFVRERRLYSRYDRKSQAYLIDLRRVSIAVGAELTREKAVIASIYAFKPRGIDIEIVFVLRVKPTELIRILKERSYPPAKIRENVLAELIDQPLHEAVSKFEADKIIQLNVTGCDLSKLASEAAEKIAKGDIKLLNSKVDWIKTLEEESSLERVLRFIESPNNSEV